MKHNALIRIILWSIVITVLTTLMVGVGFGVSFNRRTDRTETVQTVTTPPEATIAPYAANATVTANAVNVRQMPNSDSTVAGVLEKGTSVMVTRTESVEGIRWSYITSPCSGWVQAEYLSMGPNEIPQETVISQGTNGYGCRAADIRELDIEWLAGDIKIYPDNADRITISEDGVTDDKYAMVIRRDEDSLKIRFFREERKVVGLINIPEKDLTITVPRDWVCDSLEVDAASATVEVTDLTIREVDFDGASGTCEFDNCIVDELDIDTASGDVRFVGELSILDCDAASANIYGVLKNVPQRLDMDSMSGDLELYLPVQAGFTLAMDTASGDLNTDFEIRHKDGRMVSGDGSCRISISALSGDVTIQKAQ